MNLCPTIFIIRLLSGIHTLIYFMSPTGFAVPMLISPLNKSEEDADFQSAFISLFMVITLIVYTVIVIFIY